MEPFGMWMLLISVVSSYCSGISDGISNRNRKNYRDFSNFNDDPRNRNNELSNYKDGTIKRNLAYMNDNSDLRNGNSGSSNQKFAQRNINRDYRNDKDDHRKGNSAYSNDNDNTRNRNRDYSNDNDDPRKGNSGYRYKIYDPINVYRDNNNERNYPKSGNRDYPDFTSDYSNGKDDPRSRNSDDTNAKDDPSGNSVYRRRKKGKQKLIGKSCPSPASKNMALAVVAGCGTLLGERYVSEIRRKRIVGGTKSEQGQWPWLVAIGTRKRWGPFPGPFKWKGCAGTLISPYWIVTAAHCFAWTHLVSDVHLRLGEHDMAIKNESQHHDVQAEAIFLNGDGGDIALIRIRYKAKFNRYVNVACLPPHPKELLPVADTCYVAGWGRTVENGKVSSVVRHVALPLHMKSSCSRNFKTAARTGEICAGHPNKGGKDACQGDSGGPLVCKHHGSFILMGVVSSGEGCGRLGNAGIYASVHYYIPWLRGTIFEFDHGKLSACPPRHSSPDAIDAIHNGQQRVVFDLPIAIAIFNMRALMKCVC